MKEFEKKILENFKLSQENYKNNFKSYHWNYQINKKENLYRIENLKDFRKNDLSYGLDDQFYSSEQTTSFFDNLINDYGENYILNLLDEENVGNCIGSFIYKNKYYSANELFHIKFLSLIKGHTNLNSESIICEIGPGYGSFASKLIKSFNSKVVLIDLQESNFLNAFYLKKIFPNKKFFLSIDTLNNKIKKSDILENDIIILNPWDKISDINFNLFVNSRSMMEMNRETINFYFKFIQKNSTKDSFFLCINRYYKDTVGYPIELHNYPFDKNWNTIISQSSWNQDHIHFLFLKRTSENEGNIIDELKKIREISRLKVKDDPRLIRRITPNFLYKIYKKIKFFFLKR